MQSRFGALAQFALPVAALATRAGHNLEFRDVADQPPFDNRRLAFGFEGDDREPVVGRAAVVDPGRDEGDVSVAHALSAPHERLEAGAVERRLAPQGADQSGRGAAPIRAPAAACLGGRGRRNEGHAIELGLDEFLARKVPEAAKRPVNVGFVAGRLAEDRPYSAETVFDLRNIEGIGHFASPPVPLWRSARPALSPCRTAFPVR